MTLDIFQLSLGDALQQLGHEVRYLGEFDAEELDAEIQDFQPEMIVDMGWDVWQQDKYYLGELTPIRNVIRKHRVFHLYFAEEDWLHFDRWSKRYCEIMLPNFILTRSPLTIRRYEEMGIKATYFDVGYNPNFHKPGPPDNRYLCDVAVVANGNFTLGEFRYRSIHDLIVPLAESKDWDVKIWGRDWVNLDWCYPNTKLPSSILQGKLPFTETPAVYRSAKISVSIQTCNDQLSNRTMDILACGGLLLTSATKAVREKLRPGINCLATSSPEETIKMIDYYLEHEDERQRIADAGLRVAERFAYQHTLPSVWPEIEKAWADYQEGCTNPVAKELIENGQFLDDNQAWSVYNAERFPSQGCGLSQSMMFQGGMDNAYIQQKVSVMLGRTYLLTAWFATSQEGTSAPIHVFVQYFSEDNSLLGFGLYHTMLVNDLGLEWIQYRGITTRVPQNASYAMILINKVPEEGSAPVLVSDCKMIEVAL